MKRTLLSLLVLACLLVSVSGCCPITKTIQKADQWFEDVFW